MHVPNATSATVAPEKVTRYLLDPTNPRNGGKATFFFGFRFTRERWGELVDALREHVQQHEMHSTQGDEHGVRYTVIGRLRSPDSRNPLARSVWQVDVGATTPRFISAYPRKDEGE